VLSCLTGLVSIDELCHSCVGHLLAVSCEAELLLMQKGMGHNRSRTTSAEILFGDEQQKKAFDSTKRMSNASPRTIVSKN
jgi:hypothetical protein